MRTLARNWTVIVYLCAVVFSFVLAARHSDVRDANQNAAVRAGCTRLAARDAFSAQAADDPAIRNGIIATIPAPRGWEGSPALAQTVTEVQAGGKRVAVLSPFARALQKAGCARLFP